ncbi:MAG: site-specific integrase [archaeon]
MAQNDLYNSKLYYETFKKRALNGTYCDKKPQAIYYIKNRANIKYFEKLFVELEYKDLSYMRRINYVKSLKKTCSMTEKDLKDVTRDDVKQMVCDLNEVHKTTNSRRDYVYLNRKIWKIILPEMDHLGRPDESIVPYPWRITVNADKSLQKDKSDKFSDGDYLAIQQKLSHDPRMQCYLSLLFECLARPQEICYLNLEDVTMYDNYARIRVKSHGKEGTKDLQVIDGYYYLAEWLNKHPKRNDQTAPLFVTMSNNSKGGRITPRVANSLIKPVLKALGFNYKISNYSFKRNGVTIRYQNGEPAQNIQKIAGWTSTKQLKTYDLSEQKDFLDDELIKRGIIEQTDKGKALRVTFKQCAFCNTINPLAYDNCTSCKRPLDREEIMKADREKDQTVDQLKERMRLLEEMMLKMGMRELHDKVKATG